MRWFLLGLLLLALSGGIPGCGGEAEERTPATTATPPPPAVTRPIRTIDDAEARRLQTAFCTSCHSLKRVRRYRADYEGWLRQIRQGSCRKSVIPPLDAAALAYYLSRRPPAGR